MVLQVSANGNGFTFTIRGTDGAGRPTSVIAETFFPACLAIHGMNPGAAADAAYAAGKAWAKLYGAE
jgi:hypothetical protein